MTAPFVLAHLSDPHLGPMPLARWRELASKRILGFANWQRRRGRHRPEVLRQLQDDLQLFAPDHIAVTGDLVNIALESEFSPARAWLESLGGPRDVTVVPGNHDAYVRATALHAHLHWDLYMSGDTGGPVAFPFVRRRGPLALIGLSTAVATAPFMATGRLGPPQLALLAERLDALAKEGAFRVVLLHHPPLPATGDRRKRLIDAPAFRAVLAKHGAELVLRGHDHVHALEWLEGPAARIPTIGVPSASATAGGPHQAAAYNLYRISGGTGQWRCEIVSRGLSADGARFDETNRKLLTAP